MKRSDWECLFERAHLVEEIWVVSFTCHKDTYAVWFMGSLLPWLEKLTNANRSVSSVNDRLFPVELTEIAD